MTTREQYNQMIAALEAAREGKTIEFRYADRRQHSDGWLVLKQAGWDFNRYEYRTAPEPKPPRWVAWKPEEVPVGCLFRYKTWYPNVRAMILSVNSEGITWADCSNDTTLIRVRFQELVDLCVHSLDHGKTWQPCGTLVKEEGE